MQSEADLKKKAVGEKAVEYIEDGMTIGLGSGTTVYWMLKKLGELVEGGFQVRGVPSSVKTERWAKEFGIPLVDLSEVFKLDVAIDGANEVDAKFNLIKGGGGSLLREKLVNIAAEKLIIVVDENKMVDTLGSFPLPVEVVPFGWKHTAERIAKLGCTLSLRRKGEEVFVTDNGNYVIDCEFKEIVDPATLDQQIKLIVGVVETGLFVNMTDTMIVAGENGTKIIEV